MARKTNTDKAKPKTSRQAKSKPATKPESKPTPPRASELVILTGISGSGKASALRAFEDLGYYAVDNLPLELLPEFADLVRQSAEIDRAALVVDVREGATLDRLPEILNSIRKSLATRVVFLEASEAALVRRYSETRRPHPLGQSEIVRSAHRVEERHCSTPFATSPTSLSTRPTSTSTNSAPTSDQVRPREPGQATCSSRPQLWVQEWRAARSRPGLRCALPAQSPLHPRVPQAHRQHPKVAAYVRNFPQTQEFLDRVTDDALSCCPITSRKARATSPSPSAAPAASTAPSPSPKKWPSACKPATG